VSARTSGWPQAGKIVHRENRTFDYVASLSARSFVPMDFGTKKSPAFKPEGAPQHRSLESARSLIDQIGLVIVGSYERPARHALVLSKELSRSFCSRVL
jgi:hypothetical protein